ncbi:MAG: hypothetical protein JEZ04_04715 [Spirochaetales bacterium]|nr:hypothetical protein [Spirochaetales bacterium]
MPTYEYECKECGHRFEAFQNMSDDPLTECESCSSEVKRLIFGGTGVIFKGSGFYVTDNKGKAKSQPVAKTNDGDSKTDSGAPDSKPSDSKAEKPKTESKADLPKKETVAAK